MCERRPERGRRAAFTLLEVLAAVAILGIWFTVLAGVAIQGLRAEGRNARLIRASLAADAALADVESQIDAGSFPLEEIETELDEFRVHVRALPLMGFESESETDLATYLSETLGSVNESLYEIEVEVKWIEGTDEQKLVRSTYAWDSATFLEALGATGADAEDTGGAGGTSPDADTQP